MGKASSAKKVARAARAGGRVSSGQPRSLLFPGVLSLVVILGLVLVVYARSDRRSEDLGGVPQLGDHIHQALSVWVCGEEFLPDIPEFESSIGIHTHGDGVIHIHPASQLGVGANATLDRYLKNVRDEGNLDFSVSNSKITYLDTEYEEGTTECEGVDDPQVRMAYWPNVGDDSSEAEITTGDFTDLRLTENGAGVTIYFGDPDAEIPRPPNAKDLARLGAADGGAPIEGEEGDVAEDGNTTTTAPGETTTSAPGETSDSTSTSESTTTTAAP